jgi:hypothetical protein
MVVSPRYDHSKQHHHPQLTKEQNVYDRNRDTTEKPRIRVPLLFALFNTEQQSRIQGVSATLHIHNTATYSAPPEAFVENSSVPW